MHFHLLLKNNTTKDHFKTQTRCTQQRAMEEVLQGLEWNCKFCIPIPPNGQIGTKISTSFNTGCVAECDGGWLFVLFPPMTVGRNSYEIDFWQIPCTVTSWVSSFLLPALCKDDLLQQGLSNVIANTLPAHLCSGSCESFRYAQSRAQGNSAALKLTPAIWLQGLAFSLTPSRGMV